MKAEERVKKTIEEHGLIARGDRVVLALSGGPDSLCLLHILNDLSAGLGFDLCALHVNHMLRGVQADADQLWVEEHCRSLCIPFRSLRIDVALLAKQEGRSEEEAGRLARYRALKEYAAGAKIALAHNRNDQAETVLLRLLRGTGIHGLGAMEYKREDGVIRPLLDTPRDAVEAYCLAKGLSPRMDATNEQADYARNKVRLQLLPLLEQEYNPQMKSSLVRLAASAAEDDRFLQSLAEQEFQRLCMASETGGAVSADRAELLALDPALQSRVLSRMLACCGLTEDLSYVHRQSIKELLQKGAGGKQLQLPGRYTAELFAGRFTIQRPSLQNETTELITKEETLPRLILTELSQKPFDFSGLGPNQKIADKEKLLALAEPLEIRFRRPGDRITPLGMTGSKKLKDYLIDRKVPQSQRDRLLLLCSGSQVLWVLGMDLSDTICVDKHTKFSLLLEMKYTL